jgi:hypothetical protein
MATFGAPPGAAFRTWHIVKTARNYSTAPAYRRLALYTGQHKTGIMSRKRKAIPDIGLGFRHRNTYTQSARSERL